MASLVLDFPGGLDGEASAYSVETQVRSLAWEDPLEKEMAPHSSTLAWKIPWMEEQGRPQSMASLRVGYKWSTSLLLSFQFSSVAQSCPTLCNPMNRSMPGLPVHHQLPELTQTHVHPTISSSVAPFSSCPQSLPASGSFPVSQIFA